MKTASLIASLLFLLAGPMTWAQGAGKVAVSFAQAKIQVEPGSTEATNIIKIVNTSDTAIVLRPRMVMPEGWSLVFALPEYINLEAGAKPFYLTIDLAIPADVPGNSTHQVQFQVYEQSAALAASATAEFSVPLLSDWQVLAEQAEVFIPVENKVVAFQINLKNLGNRSEILSCRFPIHKNLMITGPARKEYTLLPGEDTTLSFKARFIPSPEAPEVIDIRVETFNSDSDKKRAASIYFIVLKSEYDNRARERRNNSVELLAGNTGSEGMPEVRMQVRSDLPVGKDKKIGIDLRSPNVLSPKAIAENTQFNLSYEEKNFQARWNNNLLRTVYSKKENEHESWSAGTAFNLASKVGELELGKQELLGQTRFTGNLNYFLDLENDRQVGIATLAVDLPFQQKNKVYLSIQDMLVVDRDENPFSANGMRVMGRYEGAPSKKWRFLLENNYTSAAFAQGSPGSMSNKGQVQFQPLNLRHRLNISISNFQKFARSFQEGRQLAPNSFSRNRLSLGYSLGITPEFRLETELFGEMYQAMRYSPLAETTFPFETFTGGVSLTGVVRRFLWISYRERRLSISDFTAPNTLFAHSGLPQLRSSEWQARVQRGPLSGSFQLQYSDNNNHYLTDTTGTEAMPLRSLQAEVAWQQKGYQIGAKYFQDDQGARLHIPVSLQGLWLHRRLQWRLTGNIAHTLAQNVTSVFLRSSLDFKLPKNWNLLYRGNYAGKWFPEVENTAAITSVATRHQLGVRKDFRYSPLDGKSFDLAVACFKDENSNGVRDEGEAAMPDIRLHLSAAVDSLNTSKTLFKEAAVFSGAEGAAAFRNLPAGSYMLLVHQLFPDNDGYVSTTSEAYRLEVGADQTLELPFDKGRVIRGKVTLQRDENSSHGFLPLKGIRITATSPNGRSFSALTDKSGNFTLYVPRQEYYTVSMRNPYGDDFQLKKNAFKVELPEGAEPTVEFLIEEGQVEIDWN